MPTATRIISRHMGDLRMQFEGSNDSGLTRTLTLGVEYGDSGWTTNATNPTSVTTLPNGDRDVRVMFSKKAWGEVGGFTSSTREMSRTELPRALRSTTRFGGKYEVGASPGERYESSSRAMVKRFASGGKPVTIKYEHHARNPNRLDFATFSSGTRSELEPTLRGRGAWRIAFKPQPTWKRNLRAFGKNLRNLARGRRAPRSR
jgi:hypothetical protein